MTFLGLIIILLFIILLNFNYIFIIQKLQIESLYLILVLNEYFVLFFIRC